MPLIGRKASYFGAANQDLEVTCGTQGHFLNMYFT